MQEFKDFITKNKTCISQINITFALYKEEHRPLNCCILFKLVDCVNDSLHHSFSCWRITPSGSMLERHSSFSLVLHWCMKMIMIQQKYTIYLYTPPKHKNTHTHTVSLLDQCTAFENRADMRYLSLSAQVPSCAVAASLHP